jgi:hypothetical protein
MTKKQITAHKLANTDQAVEDLDLTPVQFRLLVLMVKLADGETGIVRRRQTELATKLGIHPRTVQRDRDQLVARGYLRPMGEARKGIVQAYKVFRCQDTAPAPYLAEIRHQRPQHTAPASPTYGPPTVHTSLLFPISLPSADLETEPGGPRLRAVALGPPSGEETGKGLGNGAAEPEPPTPKALGPLDQALADLRHQLGEKSKWLVTARVAGLADGVLTLSVMTPSDRDKIVRHCETEILEASGASALRFEFAIAVEPPPLRRMP